jgi:hypothetical protein
VANNCSPLSKIRGKQLLATFPMLGPRKGGAGADHRERTLRILRETTSDELRRCLMEIEARLCMADQVQSSNAPPPIFTVNLIYIHICV